MYVDAVLERSNDSIRVAERVNGKRVFVDHPVDNHFFINDPKGNFKTIYGGTVKKVEPTNAQERVKMLNIYKPSSLWESDINPILRCLEKNYDSKGNPALHVLFFDIETAFDEDIGYSQAEDAQNPIISISVHLQWLNQTVCLALAPNTLTRDQAEKIAADVGNTYICSSEKEMLEMFLDLVDDADVLSGWNSEYYDIVYTVNRIIRVIGGHETRRLCLWDKKPNKKEVTLGGKQVYTYDLFGRVHLDYMKLYKKYSYEEKQSYALDNIAEIELGENKVHYDGTLDQLYKRDFKKFLEYNIQDTLLLDKLDKKLKYIDLVNTIAHENTVRIQDTSGTVITTEHAIVREAHKLGLVAPNKKAQKKRDILMDDIGGDDDGDDGDDNRAAGGWVSKSRSGFHRWIGNTDMNSLYPSVIRALNMSPETIVGQIRTEMTNAHMEEFLKKGAKNTFAAFWNDKFSTEEMDFFFNDDKSTKLKLDMEGGETVELTGAELRRLIFESGNKWLISANGTIFDFTKQGIVPMVLEKWYIERKAMQGLNKTYITLIDVNGLPIKDGLYDNERDSDPMIPESDGYSFKSALKLSDLENAINKEDTILIKRIMNEHRLHVVNGKVVAINQAKNADLCGYWDKRQLVRKILLNSVYGGLLNEHHRFFDQRIGQSTTLTGRCITRHMAAMTNQIFTGEYNHGGEAIIYGDTDSCYFSVYPMIKSKIEDGSLKWTKEKAIELYNEVAKEVSMTFPKYLNDTFNVPMKNGEVVRSSRETVSISGLFVKKKRYALMVFDKEGKRLDIGDKIGKLKVTGLDLRRSDTPKRVSKFLTDALVDLLSGKEEEYIINKIRDFKKEFSKLSPWEKGTPKAVNNLTKYKDSIELYNLKKGKDITIKKPKVPGHVSASIYWNNLRDIYSDKHTMKILDGSKIVVCKLKESADNDKSSIAYPIDEDRLPDWFTSLPFDEDAMAETVVDKKIENLFGVMKWDLSMTESRGALLKNFFDFSAIKKEVD